MDFEEHKRFAEWAEDRRNFPYEDSVGKITIGIGRNIEDRGISNDEIDYLFNNDQLLVSKDVESLPYWENLDPVRQMVVFDMVFNMGITRFRGFVKTNNALARGDYRLAAAEMQDSKWFRQTGKRARALVNAMFTGQIDPAIYNQ